MGLSRTFSEINADFSRKSKMFPPRVLNVPSEGVPLQLGIGTWNQITRMTGYRAEKEV